jgi:hypothetical protein
VTTEKTRTEGSFRCKDDAVKWVVCFCVCCTHLDVHVGSW